MPRKDCAKRFKRASSSEVGWAKHATAVRPASMTPRNKLGIGRRLSYILVNRIVLENLKQRALRPLASVIAIAVQVAMVLTLVGLSRGMVADAQARARGVGADVVGRPPGSTVFSFTGNFPVSALGV